MFKSASKKSRPEVGTFLLTNINLKGHLAFIQNCFYF